MIMKENTYNNNIKQFSDYHKSGNLSSGDNKIHEKTNTYVPEEKDVENFTNFEYNNINTLNDNEVKPKMNEENYIEKLINRIEQDNKEIRDRREQDRIDNDKKLNKFLDVLKEDRKESEARLNGDMKEIRASIKDMSSKLDSTADKLESKFENLKWWIIATCIATIIGIAAMVVSVVQVGK